MPYPACMKTGLVPLPEGAQADLLGDHIKAIISSLNGYFPNLKREVQAILKDVFNLPITIYLV